MRSIAGGTIVEQMLQSPKFRTVCFAYADRWFNRFVKLMTALHEGAWLGCLSPDDLNAVTARHFDESRFYASTAHNLDGLFNWETPLLEHYFRPGSRILVAAAGAGREVLALRKAGFDAEGFECSLPLVRASEKIFDQLGEPKYLTHCPPDSVPTGQPIYDGLIVGWSGYTHIPTKLRRIAFLQALRRRALPHSPLLLSFFVRNTNFYDTVIYRTASLCRLLRLGDKDLVSRGDHLVWRRYLHRFTRDELEAEMTAAGFRVAQYSEENGSGHAIGIAD